MTVYLRTANLSDHALGMDSLVKHLVFEAEGIAPSLLGHRLLMLFMERLCDVLQLHIVSRFNHQFSPYGSTIVFVLEESHVAIHSWPERGYVHCDIVTCSDEPISATRLRSVINRDLSPRRLRLLSFKY